MRLFEQNFNKNLPFGYSANRNERTNKGALNEGTDKRALNERQLKDENPLDTKAEDARRNEFYNKLSPEEQKNIQNEIKEACKITPQQRSEFLKNDPDVKEFKRMAIESQMRAGINTFKALLDVLPAGLGEIFEGASFAAKASKFTKPARQGLNILDSTPDISMQESLAIKAGTAPLEMATGGLFPSFAVEGGRQWNKDLEKTFNSAGFRKFMFLIKNLHPNTIEISRGIIDRRMAQSNSINNSERNYPQALAA